MNTPLVAAVSATAAQLRRMDRPTALVAVASATAALLFARHIRRRRLRSAPPMELSTLTLPDELLISTYIDLSEASARGFEHVAYLLQCRHIIAVIDGCHVEAVNVSRRRCTPRGAWRGRRVRRLAAVRAAKGCPADCRRRRTLAAARRGAAACAAIRDALPPIRDRRTNGDGRGRGRQRRRGVRRRHGVVRGRHRPRRRPARSGRDAARRPHHRRGRWRGAADAAA